MGSHFAICESLVCLVVESDIVSRSLLSCLLFCTAAQCFIIRLDRCLPRNLVASSVVVLRFTVIQSDSDCKGVTDDSECAHETCCVLPIIG